VRWRVLSARSKRTTVSGDTFAAAASFRTLKPIAALAIRHCTGSNSEPSRVSLSASPVQQSDQPDSETACADNVEDQQIPITVQHLSLIGSGA
jgi:hypothetical protein